MFLEFRLCFDSEFRLVAMLISFVLCWIGNVPLVKCMFGMVCVVLICVRYWLSDVLF